MSSTQVIHEVIDLTQEEEEEEPEVVQVVEEKINRVYRCTNCGKLFSGCVEYREHFVKEHLKGGHNLNVSQLVDMPQTLVWNSPSPPPRKRRLEEPGKMVPGPGSGWTNGKISLAHVQTQTRRSESSDDESDSDMAIMASTASTNQVTDGGEGGTKELFHVAPNIQQQSVPEGDQMDPGITPTTARPRPKISLGHEYLRRLQELECSSDDNDGDDDEGKDNACRGLSPPQNCHDHQGESEASRGSGDRNELQSTEFLASGEVQVRDLNRYRKANDDDIDDHSGTTIDLEEHEHDVSVRNVGNEQVSTDNTEEE